MIKFVPSARVWSMLCITTFLVLLFDACLLGAQPRQPHIAIAGMMHESNSFNPAKTGLADFGWPLRTSREEFFRKNALSSTELSGYIEGARRFDLDLYPTVVVSADPKGPVTDEAFNTITTEMIRQLQAVPQLDGVLLALHGAMVVERYPSGDTELLRRVREALGKEIPIVVTHDFHANISPEIVALSNALLTYKENPHIDTKECGIHAARIMAEMVRGKVKPVQAVVKPPMVYNIVYQYTKRPPLLPIVEESRRLEQNPKILAVSVAGGYQYADVPQIGPSVVVVTDNDPALAQREAQRLSDMLWATRNKLVLNLPDAAAGVRLAMSSESVPVALMDLGDNIGGGSAGDGTFLLQELLRQRAQGWVVVIADAEAVSAAMRAGVGQPFDFVVGGKTDHLHGVPTRVRGLVRSLHVGRYIETEVRHGGGRYHDMGLTAVIEGRDSTPDRANLLVLTTYHSTPDSLQQLISVGVYPMRQNILVVKGAIAPRAAYEPVAARIIAVDTPGLTAVNPARFTFKRARRPLFGLD